MFLAKCGVEDVDMSFNTTSRNNAHLAPDDPQSLSGDRKEVDAVEYEALVEKSRVLEEGHL